MSCGIVTCSECKREVHQDGEVTKSEHGFCRGWRHCEDSTHMCAGARIVYPESTKEIRGKWCGRDDMRFL